MSGSRHSRDETTPAVALDATGPDLRTKCGRLVGICVDPVGGGRPLDDWLPSGRSLLIGDERGWTVHVPDAAGTRFVGWLQFPDPSAQRLPAYGGGSLDLEKGLRYVLDYDGEVCRLSLVEPEAQASGE